MGIYLQLIQLEHRSPCIEATSSFLIHKKSKDLVQLTFYKGEALFLLFLSLHKFFNGFLHKLLLILVPNFDVKELGSSQMSVILSLPHICYLLHLLRIQKVVWVLNCEKKVEFVVGLSFVLLWPALPDFSPHKLLQSFNRFNFVLLRSLHFKEST